VTFGAAAFQTHPIPDRLPSTDDTVIRQVDHQIAQLDSLRNLVCAPPTYGVNARFYLIEIEGFYHIVIGTTVQSVNPVRDLVARSQNDDRRPQHPRPQ
jgi:hypothetical protein